MRLHAVANVTKTAGRCAYPSVIFLLLREERQLTLLPECGMLGIKPADNCLHYSVSHKLRFVPYPEPLAIYVQRSGLPGIQLKRQACRPP